MNLESTFSKKIIDSIDLEEYRELFREMVADIIRSEAFKEGFTEQLLNSDALWELQASLIEHLKDNLGPIQARLVFTNDL